MKISKEVQDQINAQYVEMRKNPEAEADEIKLSRWISSMKVLSFVNGEQQAKFAHFLEAVSMG